ncbi:MAG TPA: alpha/beta fold hydrolase, partial [Nitrospira sp.]|nr:alpha/beta fold hydrolase [Nitrospira sp.]
MNAYKKSAGVAAIALAAQAVIVSPQALADDGGGDGDDLEILAVEHWVPHVSSVPANQGEAVELFVRERLKASDKDKFQTNPPEGKVVLFVHGGSTPSVPAFDLDYEDYSWMKYLAKAGFDVFSMDRQGYGRSPRPKMDDPCNTNPAQQHLLIPFPLPAPCPVIYPFRLSSSHSDWDELNTVVHYIRELRGVDKITIAGWSAAGPLGGGWVVNNQDKVDKLVFLAANYVRTSPNVRPAVFPVPGFPMTLRTKDEFLNSEWGPEISCEDQVDPAVQNFAWETIMDFDSLGSTWGASGVM